MTAVLADVAGVAELALIALERTLKAAGWYSEAKTVADVRWEVRKIRIRIDREDGIR